MFSAYLKSDSLNILKSIVAQPIALVAHGFLGLVKYDTSSINLFTAELETEWKRSAVRRYAITAAAVAIALLASLAARPVFHRSPFLFYYAAVMFSAWQGGLFAGLAATAAAAVGAGWVLIGTLHTRAPLPDDFAQIALFIGVGVVTSLLSESLRKSERASRGLYRAQEFLAEAGRMLGSSFDYEKRLALLAHSCVPVLADCCAVDLLQDDETLRRITHSDVARPECSSGPAQSILVKDLPEIAAAIENRQPRLFDQVDSSLLERWTSDRERQRELTTLGVSSAMVVPMVSGKRVLGAITLLCASSGRRYSEGDVTIVERLASRAAFALENAELYRQAQNELRERERVEAELRRQHQRLTGSLRQQASIAVLGQRAMAVWFTGTDLFELMDGFVQQVAATLGVQYCKVLELAPRRDRLLLRAGVGWKEGLVGSAWVDADMKSQAGYTLMVNRPVIVEDVHVEARFHAPSLLNEHAVVSGISVVIPGPDGPYGVLGAHSRESHSFSEDDAHFMEAAATLLSAAIQRDRHLQQLQASEARFRTLAEAMPQMVWSTTADGCVDYLSESWRHFTGQSEANSLGYNGWKQALHPEDAEQVLDRWSRSMATGEIYEVECRLRGADGEYRWALARGVPLRDSEGMITKWIGTCTDVHEHKLAEETLRTAEKLAATGRLVSTMAHEINNPLEAITNLLHLLHSDPALENGSPAHYLQLAERELARVNHVVNQTMGLFQGSTVPTEVSVAQVADEVLELYSGKITAKGLRVERQHYDTDTVCALRGEVRQVLATLIANAIDAAPLSGVLMLRIRKTRSWSEQGEGGVRVLVADNGFGIPTDLRGRLFTPFFSTKEGVGTGLALWGTKEILRRTGGTIRFRSSTKPGASGTAFSIFLHSGEAKTKRRSARVA
jgi:PAS domain S-box-containing protein